MLDRPLSRVTDVRQLSFIVVYDHDAFSPDNFGRGVEVHEMDTRIVEQCIDWLEKRG